MPDSQTMAEALFNERDRGFQEAVDQLRQIGREEDWNDCNDPIPQIIARIADAIESVGCSIE